MTNNIIILFFVLLYANTSYGECKKDVVDVNNVSNYSYVLIPGLFNEFIAFYMTEYKNYLLEMGVPKEQILRFNSSSFEYPQKESIRLFKRLQDFSPDKPLVIFAHSKGALETLYMLKDFDLSKIHHVYFLQGPFDGASSHEIFYTPSDEEDAWSLKVAKKLAKWAFLSNRYSNFSKEEVRKRVKQTTERPGVLEKLTFVISETDYENLPTKLKLLGGLYETHFDVPGDGVLLKENQLPKDLDVEKTCVLDIPASHDLFVKAAPWDSERISKIHSFIKYLLMDQQSNPVF